MPRYAFAYLGLWRLKLWPFGCLQMESATQTHAQQRSLPLMTNLSIKTPNCYQVRVFLQTDILTQALHPSGFCILTFCATAALLLFTFGLDTAAQILLLHLASVLFWGSVDELLSASSLVPVYIVRAPNECICIIAMSADHTCEKMCSEKDVGQTLTAMIRTQKQDCAANYVVMHVSKPVMDSSHFWWHFILGVCKTDMTLSSQCQRRKIEYRE